MSVAVMRGQPAGFPIVPPPIMSGPIMPPPVPPATGPVRGPIWAKARPTTRATRATGRAMLRIRFTVLHLLRLGVPLIVISTSDAKHRPHEGLRCARFEWRTEVRNAVANGGPSGYPGSCQGHRRTRADRDRG